MEAISDHCEVRSNSEENTEGWLWRLLGEGHGDGQVPEKWYRRRRGIFLLTSFNQKSPRENEERNEGREIDRAGQGARNVS